MAVQKNACRIILQIKIGTSSHFIRLSGSVRTSFSECGANLSGMSCPKMISSTVFIFSGSSIASLNKNLFNRLSFENPFLLLICFWSCSSFRNLCWFWCWCSLRSWSRSSFWSWCWFRVFLLFFLRCTECIAIFI